MLNPRRGFDRANRKANATKIVTAMTATLDFVLCLLGARLSYRMVVVIRCPSPKLRKTLNLARVTMLPASLHAIHYTFLILARDRAQAQASPPPLQHGKLLA
jgi:hypothetical protein